MPLQQLVSEILFVRTSYVKKIIEDCSNSEETVKLLRFSCWENPQFSSTVLSELLWQVSVKTGENTDGHTHLFFYPHGDLQFISILNPIFPILNT